MKSKDFKEALSKVYNNDIDRIINNKYMDYKKSRSYIAQEKRRAKADKEFLTCVLKTEFGIEGAPFMALLNEIKSTEVLKNIIAYMIGKGD